MTILIHKPGQPLPAFRSGDFYLTYSKSWIGLLIRFGERLHRKDRRFTWASHAGLIVSDDGTIIEALSGGLTVGNISKYQGQSFALVRPDFSDEDRAEFIRYALSEKRRHPKYGWADALSCAVQMLTPLKFDFNWAGTLICSAYVAMACVHAGYILSTNSPFVTTPGDLAAMFGVLKP